MDGEERVLAEDRSLYSARKNATITLKAGFRYRASVPRVFWAFRAPSDCREHGPLGHDGLYQCTGDPSRLPEWISVEPAGVTWTRGEADLEFHDWQLLDGVASHVAEENTAGVRIAGWWAWWKNGRALKARARGAR